MSFSLDQPGEHTRGLDPRDRGVTSSKSTSFTSLGGRRPELRADGDDFIRIDAFMRFLTKEAPHDSCTLGMRVMPPTSTTSLISPR